MKAARRALLAALLAAPGLLPGCMTDSPDDYSFPASNNPDPEGWVESGTFICRDFELLWETAKIHAVRGGYRIDDDATSLRSRRIVTTWKVDLATTKNAGHRKRRFVAFSEDASVQDGWKARVATVRQRNVDMDEPLNPMRAEWRSHDPDLEDAERVAYMIESQFRDYGPSKEFEVR